MKNEPQLLRKPEAALFLSMPLSTLEKHTARKQIPHVKIGRAVRYDITDLRAWIETKKIPVASPSESN
jgi:excisionase family DNA binding protein